MSQKRIYLVGFMGSGKSTIGKKLAQRLKWRFIDTDSFIEEQTGLSINSIFETQGEEAFRKKETEVLATFSKEENIIIATGGGLPCHSNNLDTIQKSGLSIYLKVSKDSLFHRLKNAKNDRPLLRNKTDGELQQYIDEKLIEREKFYLRSDFLLNGESVNVEDVVKMIEFQER